MSDQKSKSLWRRMYKGRLVALTSLISYAGFVFWLSTTDVPPFDEPGTILERILLIASDVICWPVCVVILGLPEAAANILLFPAFILSGLFWAILIELVLVRKARSA